ncbi:MAG: hypothetical protein JRE92_03760 [Deltaproteobacteria bacterium]|nr:hypothetical protein [Deltaproteobacteria bacterium]
MPRTVIDFKKPLSIPPGHLIWGMITCAADLESNSICLKERTQIKEGYSRGFSLRGLHRTERKPLDLSRSFHSIDF